MTDTTTIEARCAISPARILARQVIDARTLLGEWNNGQQWGVAIANPSDLNTRLTGDQPTPITFHSDGGQFGIEWNAAEGWAFYIEIEIEADDPAQDFAWNALMAEVDVSGAVQYDSNSGVRWFSTPFGGPNRAEYIASFFATTQSGNPPSDWQLKRVTFWPIQHGG